MEIAELVAFCKDNGIHYPSTVWLLESIQPDFLRIDAATLLRIEAVGLEEEAEEQIAQQLLAAVKAHGGYLAAARVEDFSDYPALNVPWTPFLLESVAGTLSLELNVILILFSSGDIPHTIFVDETYAEEDWGSLIVRLLRQRQEQKPFLTKTEVQDWLKEEGLSNAKIPLFLEKEGHVRFDETGALRVE